MTYEEIVELVRKKSSICEKCGCFVSSLLECCPACGWMCEKNSLVESYKALGGNSAVEKIEEIRAGRKRIPKRKDVGLEMMKDYEHLLKGAAKRSVTVSQTLYDRMLDDGSLDSAILYFIDNQFYTEYVPHTSYTAYYKAKTDALNAQQHTMRLYEEAIKALKSYSGRIDYE